MYVKKLFSFIYNYHPDIIKEKRLIIVIIQRYYFHK